MARRVTAIRIPSQPARGKRKRSTEAAAPPVVSHKPAPGEEEEREVDGGTYETFFCVHSRFWRTSRASSMPSAKRARERARRACACFWSSRSSRCFAFRRPEL